MTASDALLDMPPDDGAGRVPPLLMAAARAGMRLRKIDQLLFAANELTDPVHVLVSVRSDGYTVRRKMGRRWKTLCREAKRTETVIKHLKELT